MDVALWSLIFLVSLAVMLRGADWLLVSGEQIGRAKGLSPFVIGVLIVGVGTSLPELVSSLAAIAQGATEIVPANAVGSNITNILLIVGLSAVIARKLEVTKNLMNLELPLLAIATAMAAGAMANRNVSQVEGAFLLLAFVVYVSYTLLYREQPKPERAKRPKTDGGTALKLIVGVIALAVGANYVIESVIQLSELFRVSPGLITLAVVALGTSLPELTVSLKAAIRGNSEVALGNIFGSNAINALLVLGLPALISGLVVDQQTFSFALPVFVVVTLLFILSSLSRRIHIYDGGLYVLIYCWFIGHLFGLV